MCSVGLPGTNPPRRRIGWRLCISPWEDISTTSLGCCPWATISGRRIRRTSDEVQPAMRFQAPLYCVSLKFKKRGSTTYLRQRFCHSRIWCWRRDNRWHSRGVLRWWKWRRKWSEVTTLAPEYHIWWTLQKMQGMEGSQDELSPVWLYRNPLSITSFWNMDHTDNTHLSLRNTWLTWYSRRQRLQAVFPMPCVSSEMARTPW